MPPRRSANLTPANRNTEEAKFQQRIVTDAGKAGWVPFYVMDSRRSPAGWPDLVLMRYPRLLFIELKSRNGILSAAQRWWLDNLRSMGNIINEADLAAGSEQVRMDTYIWRDQVTPWEEIWAVLGVSLATLKKPAARFSRSAQQ